MTYALFLLTSAVVLASSWAAIARPDMATTILKAPTAEDWRVGDIPKPSPDVLAWTKREVGAFFSFNMISMLVNISNTQYFCLGVGGAGGSLPDPSTFNPDKLDLDNWLRAAVAFGAKYAVLTAQHCSGFSMWPTDLYAETGFNYTYSTKHSPFRGGGYDVVRDFINSCKKYGVLPGIYYSLNQNYYLNVGGGTVKNTSLVPGQVNVSQELYGKIVVAQMKELWSNYGNISEIWFDGGCSVPGIREEVSKMLAELQPHAVDFQSCSDRNQIRWVGTESGEPGYPLWSTANNCAYGLGNPHGNTFCPAETDTTLQEFDHWFWRPNFPIRSLIELQSVYYHSVGQNTNLLLNVAANSSGLIEDSYYERYKEFGNWIWKCFVRAVAETSGVGYSLEISGTSDEPFQFNKVVVSEDQTNGEAVLSFTVTALLSNGTLVPVLMGQSIGHKFVRDVGTLTATHVMLSVKEALQEPMFTIFSVHYC